MALRWHQPVAKECLRSTAVAQAARRCGSLLPTSPRTASTASEAGYLYCPPGAPQNDTGEQFLVVSSGANSISAGQPLGPGSAIFLKSLQTGKYCRVVSVQGKQQIMCDVEDPQAPGEAGASVFDYTGSGFSYKGQGFANYGGDEPLQLEEGGVPAGVAPGGCMAVGCMVADECDHCFCMPLYGT